MFLNTLANLIKGKPSTLPNLMDLHLSGMWEVLFIRRINTRDWGAERFSCHTSEKRKTGIISTLDVPFLFIFFPPPHLCSNNQVQPHHITSQLHWQSKIDFAHVPGKRFFWKADMFGLGCSANCLSHLLVSSHRFTMWPDNVLSVRLCLIYWSALDCSWASSPFTWWDGSHDCHLQHKAYLSHL